MSSTQRYAAAAAAYLGTFLASLSISIVSVALPTLQTELQTDIAGLQWVVNAYALCLSAFMLSAGPIADRQGHRRAWLIGAVIFTIGSALCGLASSFSMLLIGRAIQGISASLLISGAMPILTHAFPEPEKQAHVIGGWSAFSALALILGPIIGGILIATMGWKSIFLMNIPLCLIAIVLGLWGIPEHKYPDDAARDPLGQFISIIALGALTYGMIEAGSYGFSGFIPIVSLIVAVIGFILFAIIEMRVKQPLLPLSLCKQGEFSVLNLASFVLGFSYYACLFFFSIYLQQIQSWTATQAGWRMLPLFAMTGLVSMLFGRLSLWLSVRHLNLIGYSLIGIVMCSMFILGSQTPYWQIAILFAFIGVGAGMTVPGTGVAIMSISPPAQSGSVSAMLNALRQAGMTIGVAFLGTIMSSRAISVLESSLQTSGFDNAGAIAVQAVQQHDIEPQLEPSLTAAMESGFHWAMILGGLSCLIVVVLMLVVHKSDEHKFHPEQVIRR
ncbi:MFS transporter [Bartonella sp. LJL80]